MYIRVAVPIPRLEPLTYVVHDHEGVSVGFRVVVPVGKRLLTGTIVEVNSTPIAKAKYVEEILDTGPTFSPEMIELARRVSDYYLCAWGEVLQAALPNGMQPNAVMRIRLERQLSVSELEALRRRAPKRAALLEALEESQGDVTVAYLQKKMMSSYVSDQLEALLRDGWISIHQERVRQTKSRMIRCVTPSKALKEDDTLLRQTLGSLDRHAPRQSLALAFVLLHFVETPIPVNYIVEQTGVGIGSIDALITKGLIEQSLRDYHYQDELGSLARPDEHQLVLHDQQQLAYDRIASTLHASAFDVHLLQGVTGSGKTLVYQRLIKDALSAGKAALLLVPEIALTPQLGDRFRAMFGDSVAILHSRISMGERIQIWNRIASGSIRVVIGARSAILVDVPKLGVIIVDEEHEPSYKQEDPAPRYNGRDVAIMRAQIVGCPVVLGSATPSMETYQNALTGRYHHHKLTIRADNAAFPTIRLLDMRQLRKTRQLRGSFALETLQQIASRIQRHESVLVYLNKRGFATQIQCHDCGNVEMCLHCDVALTYHKHPGVLKCHYCGVSAPFQHACQVCGSTDVYEIGTGTQRIEEELTSALQDYCSRTPSIARMDADTTARKGQHRKLLGQFSSGHIDILIGTQMVAKGLDVARCTLVIVVNADLSLYHTDFRASERTMQLLLQVSGRAGRRAIDQGMVILQSYSPLHPTMQLCLDGESRIDKIHAWYGQELQARQESGYPPFTRFIAIEIRSNNEAAAQHHAEIVFAMLPKDDRCIVAYPPMMPSISRIRNVYRRVVIVKNPREHDPSGQKCRSYLRSLQQSYHKHHAAADVRISIDMDARGTL